MSQRGRTKFHRALGVLLLSALILVVLVFVEYKQNIALIDSNEEILISSAKESLKLYISQDLRELPDSVDTLKKQWIDAPHNFFLFVNEKQGFPFLHKPGAASMLAALMDIYQQDTPTAEEHFFSVQRQQIVSRILRLRDQSKVEDLRAALAEMLQHKQHYILGPQEEIVSWLALLNKDSDKSKGWSQDFVRAVLVDNWASSPEIPSVASVLFENLESLSLQDVLMVFDAVEEIAQRYEINIDQLRYLKAQLDKPFDLPPNLTQGLWLKDMTWLLSKGEGSSRVYAIDIQQRLFEVEGLLKTQGVLLAEDKLSLIESLGWKTLDATEIKLEKASIVHAKRRQLNFLSIKLLAIAIFTCLVMYVLTQIERNAQQKQRLIDRQEDFTNLVSHELRTPISAIRAMAETLEKRLRQRLDPKDYTTRLIAEADRLENMIENIISLNQLPNTRDLNVKPVRLAGLVNEVVHDFKAQLGDKFKVSIALPASLEIDTNIVLFSLVIRNIITNAIKYSQSEPAAVHFYYRESEQILCVEDNGIGIKKENWERVFERFFRVKEHSGSKGLGLGLHLSRAIMKSLGGDLRISESKESGTVWHIWLKKN